MTRGRPKTFDNNDVLEQAMRVFWRNGYDATSLDDLLQAMEIPRQSLYRTFGDKRTLFLRALELYTTRTGHAVFGILKAGSEQADTSAIEGIREIFRFWETILTSPQRDGCMIQNTCSQSVFNDKEVAAIILEHQNKITCALSEALERGQLEGGICLSIEPSSMANTIVTSINGLLGLSRIGLPPEVTRDVFQTLQILFINSPAMSDQV